MLDKKTIFISAVSATHVTILEGIFLVVGLKDGGCGVGWGGRESAQTEKTIRVIA